MSEEQELLQEASPEVAEENWDAVLEKMDSSEEEVGVIGTSPEPDKIGEGAGDPVKKEQAAPEEAPDKTEEPTENTTVDNDEVREEPEVQVDGLEEALTSLRRDGLSQSVIEKMTNEEILELGSKRAKVQRDTDDAYRQLQDLKKAKETATENEQIAAPEAKPLADLGKAVQPFAAIFGKDAGDALKAAQHDTIAPLVEKLEATTKMVESVLLESSRGKLTGQYPQLSQDESYQRVHSRMESLVKTGDYNDMGALMSDAARIEFSEESANVSRELNERQKNFKDQGQMTPVDKGETPAHAMSKDERELALLDALESGMTVSDARRTYGA